MAFKKLFSPTAQPNDGMLQSAREAIVDLLHFGVYVDSHIALAEDAMVEAAARQLSWDPNISFDYYEGKSIGEVRRVRKDEGECEEFFQTIRDRLPKREDRQLALKLVEQLFAADGTTAIETQSLPMIRKALELR
ncbi:MAG: hypothetical protein IPL39_08040 [Opitutaceae bacterium]|nr:hypothetical protein [Opitutaceae bacterium]